MTTLAGTTAPVLPPISSTRGVADAMRQGAVALHAALEHVFERNGAWYAAVGALLVLQVGLIVAHRPWLDEWQALQIALQSPDLSSLGVNLRYEGHPPLWYLLLRGASAVVPAGWVLPAVQLPIAIALQAMVLGRSPFTRLERLLLATSFFILFDYGVLSRSLSLGVALLTAAIAFRHHRASWIAIALLPMADFLFGLLSLACLAIQARERRLWGPGVLTWAITGILAALSVRPPADIMPAFELAAPLTELGGFVVRLSSLLVPLQMQDGVLQWNAPLPLVVAPIAGALFLIFADRQCRHDGFHRMLFLGFAAITALFSMFVYPLAIRHLSLLAWLLVLLTWRARERGARADGAFRLWLWAISLCGLVTAGVSVAKPFDTADLAAAYIQQERLVDQRWASFPDSRAQGVSALTGIEFERLERGCVQSFIRWNYRSAIRTPSQLARALRVMTADGGRMYLLTDMSLATIDDPQLIRLVNYFPAGYDGQEYWIYMLRPAGSPSPRRPPACVPGHLPLPD